MSDCSFCQYRLKEDDNTNQTCSKWVNNDDQDIPCKPSGKEIGDSPNDSSDNCSKVECPSHCQYPYPKEIYNSDAANSDLYGTNSYPLLKEIKDDPDRFNKFISDTTNDTYLKEEIKTYNKDNIPANLNLKCGDLITPGQDDSINFPSLPTEIQLKEAIDQNIEIEDIGIDWGSIKETNKLRELYNDQINGTNQTVTINNYTIPLSNEGIELEWWDKTYTNDQLKLAIPENIREYQDLNVIHQTTGGILNYALNDHNVSTMVVEEVYDWLKKRRIGIDNNIREELKGSKKKFSMAQFFGITSDEATNIEFEQCINRIMITEHDDDDYLKRINTYTHLSELGNPKNRKDLLYVEAKIIKFIIINPKSLSKCFDIVYITDKICKKGLSSSAIEMLGYFLKLNTNNIENDKYKDNMRIISNRLLKYLPDIIKKIIEIAEYYENKTCNHNLTKNTILLKEIYTNLFEKNNRLSFEYPDLGIIEFFQDFQRNIFTKSVLLIFIAFIITQFIGLFSIQYNINK